MSNKTMKDIKLIKLPGGREHKIGYEFFYEDKYGDLQDAGIYMNLSWRDATKKVRLKSHFNSLKN